ncbi:MAG: toll/interleukin-1 receptor domain-containing protein [Ktedonobacteraceae bacterium]
MAVCRRCGLEVSGISSLFTFNRQKGRCKKCEIATQQALIRFREAFLHLSSDLMVTIEKMQYLEEQATKDYIEFEEALEFIRKDALSLLDRVLDEIIAQGEFTDQAESYIRQLQLMLAVSDTEAQAILRQIRFLNIYRGKFPIVSQERLQGIHLGSDETCYLLTSAQYLKVNKTSTELISGRLVATNKKLRFLSVAGGTEILWNSVMSIKRQSKTINNKVGNSVMPLYVSGIYLELNKRAGNGFYSVSDPYMAEAIIDTLIRIANGQIVKIDTDNSHDNPLQLRQYLDNRESESESGRKQSEEPDKVLLREQEKMQVAELVIPKSNSKGTIEVFYSYAHKDEKLRNKLETQLSLLKQQGHITNWHDRKIDAGQEWANEINEHLNAADIILLLVSPDFLASNYCYSIEMKRALERHERGEARVIPVIIRPVYWQGAPIGKLQALPKDAKPVTSWNNQDEAFFNVAEGIRKIVEEIRNRG